MQAKSSTWTLGSGVRVMAVERNCDPWIISAAAREIGSCPGCGVRSRRRHSRYSPFTGPAGARSGRRNDDALALSEQVVRTKNTFRSASRRRRPTCASDITRWPPSSVIWHGAGGKPSERLIKPSRHAYKRRRPPAPVEAKLNPHDQTTFVCWTSTIGGGGRERVTEIMDLERREVVDV